MSFEKGVALGAFVFQLGSCIMDTFKDKIMLSEEIKSNGHEQNKISVSNKIKRVPHEGVFMSVSKKAEKITTAIYMVTDLIDTADPMRNRVRERALSVLSDTRSLSYALTGDLHFHIARIISKSWEIVSLLEVSTVVGFVSDMNYSVLKHALIEFIGDLRNRQRIEGFSGIRDMKMAEGEASNLVLRSDFFRVEDSDMEEYAASVPTKETPISKRHYEKPMSFIKRPTKITAAEAPSMDERKQKIITLITEKKDIAIKDIVSYFKDYSQKTVLRDLNALVVLGKVKKSGEKRWSRYSLNA